jgi:hypothetical protein
MTINATAETKNQDGEVISSTYDAGQITVGYERTVSLPSEQYKTEKATASIYVRQPLDLGESVEGRTAVVKESFMLAKGGVNEQLGLKSEIDANMVVREIVEKHFGAVGSGATEAEAESNTPVQPKHQTQGNAAPKSKADLWADLQANPKNWFDNRATKTKDTSPDFKRKQTGEGLWITGKFGNEAEKFGVTLPDPSAF